MRLRSLVPWCVGLVLSSLPGCTRAPRGPDPTVSLTLLGVDVKKDDKVKFGGPELAIVSPGNFALTVKAARAVHLYLIHQGATAASVLYPPTDTDATIAAGEKARVPAADGFVALPELAAGDRLCIVARTTPAERSTLQCGSGSTPLLWSFDRGETTSVPPPPTTPPAAPTPPPQPVK